MYHSLFTYWWTCISFQFGAVKKLLLCTSLCVDMILFFLSKCLRLGWLGHVVFSCVRNCQTGFQNDRAVWHSHQQCLSIPLGYFHVLWCEIESNLILYWFLICIIYKCIHRHVWVCFIILISRRSTAPTLLIKYYMLFYT